MPTRGQFIEQIQRQIYNGYVSDDAEITTALINQYLNQAIGVAAQKNYTDSLQLDGIASVNNSFYTTFSGLAITNEGAGVYKITLPQVPVALGRNEGVSTLQFKDGTNPLLSHTAIPLTTNQVAYKENIRPIQNKTVYWSEGNFLYAKSVVGLTAYTATVRMISGGDSSNLDSVLIIPENYIPIIVDYIQKQLLFEKKMPQDNTNDGVDN